jgi:hypothetical protein
MLTDEARRLGREVMFQHGMQALDVARDRLELARRQRNAEAVARWIAVVEVVAALVGAPIEGFSDEASMERARS